MCNFFQGSDLTPIGKTSTESFEENEDEEDEDEDSESDHEEEEDEDVDMANNFDQEDHNNQNQARDLIQTYFVFEQKPKKLEAQFWMV